MIDTPFLILAGGLATRLYPITQNIPKSLIYIDNRPFIFHQLDLLAEQDVQSVILCVGHLGHEIVTTVGHRYKNINIQYSFDGDKRLGTGGAIKKAISERLIYDSFCVLYGDSYLPTNYGNVIEFHRKSMKSATMTVFKNTDQYDKSNILFENETIVKYDKFTPDSNMKYIDYGFGVYEPSAFSKNICGEEFDLAKTLIRLVADKQLAGFEVFERFYEIGSMQGIQDTSIQIKS